MSKTKAVFRIVRTNHGREGRDFALTHSCVPCCTRINVSVKMSRLVCDVNVMCSENFPLEGELAAEQTDTVKGQKESESDWPSKPETAEEFLVYHGSWDCSSDL